MPPKKYKMLTTQRATKHADLITKPNYQQSNQTYLTTKPIKAKPQNQTILQELHTTAVVHHIILNIAQPEGSQYQNRHLPGGSTNHKLVKPIQVFWIVQTVQH